ncbi:hypothetical protein GCK32_002522 [Trichostrongylus colubriformis]|uniref:Uncharacterized protein n=1 Tax=Trichostrongylus colubriformis TaxID=6319 RepID=A0AAN8EQ96_TRICO
MYVLYAVILILAASNVFAVPSPLQKYENAHGRSLRSKRQFGFSPFGMGGYGRPYGMMGGYGRPYGGMGGYGYRPYGMMGGWGR